MKNLLIKLLRSFFRSPAFFLKFRDTIMTNAAEHLYRTRSYIYSQGFESTGIYILDIGAASGDTCRWFARNFPGAKVIGFEPVFASFQKAQHNTKELTGVQLYHLALSDLNGTAEITVTKDNLASSLKKISAAELEKMQLEERGKFSAQRSETVKKQRLDEVLTGNEPVLLMKIDTQGTELEVLRGAVRTLSRTRLVLVEMNNHRLYEEAAKYHEVDEMLRSKGFCLIDIYVTYRPAGVLKEYDALYQNSRL